VFFLLLFFPVLFFSTLIHRYAQMFSAILVDVKTNEVYLPFQIEPEAKNFTVQAGSRESLTTIALSDWTGEFRNFAVRFGNCGSLTVPAVLG